MAEIPDTVIQSVERFLAAVRRLRRLDAAYLYGSRARGTATEWSDIDLAVVSPDFSSDVFQERLILMRLAVQVDDRIEPHPFRPEDFNASDPLACEVRRTGVRVG
jgi:predicted nucleotidyltransferase